jgi:hypothetical protein
MRRAQAGGAVVGACLALLVAALGLGGPASGSTESSDDQAVAPAAAAGPFATLLFSRSEITAADDCVANSTGIARLDTTVAPFLTQLGMSGTGTLTTDKTLTNAFFCTHVRSSLTASWNAARQLASQRGWSFTSHTATYPANTTTLSPTRAEAETCGSARTLDAQGVPGGHGMISYPGAQGQPTQLHSQYGARCFAWGREYGSSGLTFASAGTTAPYWQHTLATNGGACNVSTASCYTIASTGSKRYQLPSKFINVVNGLDPGEWFTLQSYVLVTGRSPSYRTSPIRWDCTSTNVRLHWTNDNERYCYSDWQRIVRVIDARTDITVTDPLTVGIAFGRPATYP